MRNNLLGISTIALLLYSGCAGTVDWPSPELPPSPEVIVEVKENPVPGTVNTLWAEPMYDTVRVPGQLDPTATYYRLPHSTVLEIRSEKYQQVEYPEDTEQDPALLGAPTNHDSLQ